MNRDAALKAAVRNIATHGDTDVFPFPFECHLFYDAPDACVKVLKELDSKFDEFMATYPADTIITLTQVGYTGFRWATQIEPFWNAYYLALVIQIADQIERERIPESEEMVFSYRYTWQEQSGKLFKDLTWRDYKRKCLELSANHDCVVVTDIADFYSRIYHHRIDNALRRLPNPGNTPQRIMQLLSAFSKNVSYGLPIGGPASRVLAELALVDVDRHLRVRHVPFCRYADDFCLFCADRAEAYRMLVFLSEKLFNEGLGLQKKKTRILSAKDYKEASKAFLPLPEEKDSSDEHKLLNISLRFDPYSPTAEEDYERLKNTVSEIDIISILGREIAKTAIDPTVSKQAINAVKALDPVLQGAAIRTILDPDNLEVLSPVFVTILRLVRSVYRGLNNSDKDFVDQTLLQVYNEQSPLLSVELNFSYFIQVLGQRYSQPKEELLVKVFGEQRSPLIRRLILLILADWKCHYWLRDLKAGYGGLSVWEKRGFILASYVLGDEGEHWRSYAKRSWSPMDHVARDWFAERFNKNSRMPI